MDNEPRTQQPDPAHQLQRDIYYQLVETLRTTLPPPLIDTPEDWARRDRVAIAKVASLVPANPEEADLAAHAVAASAHASDCLRLAVEQAADVTGAGKLRAQSASMGREARGYCSMLLRAQAARIKRETKDVTRDQAAWTEHCVQGLMMQALATIAPAPVGEAPAAEHEPPQVRVEATTPPPQVTPILVDTAEQQPDPAAEAETYAIVYPRRARLIRQCRGLPADCDFGPPEPELMQAIIAGTSPTLRALDRPFAATA